ncbi:MAG: DegV family protein [Clostridiales bacterium]|nr:DegV family protein [Clostridiales bacterium]
MENQKKVLISCDSTCDLSPELLERFSIALNPLFVVMNGKTLRDGVDVYPDDIYAYYKTTGEIPKTTAANTEDFLAYFKPFVEQGYAVVHFTISSSMSATFNNARLAAAELEDVYVIDSKCLSTGAGLEVLKAAELAADGVDARSIASYASSMWERVDASFVIDSLEYLHKGGRCSSVAALGANLLRLKPCIEVKNGVMGVGKKYRGRYEDVLLEYAAARLADGEDIDTDRVFVTHAGCRQEVVNRVADKVRELLPFKEVLVTRAGCSVSVHCGPNTLGVLFVRKSPIIK